MKKSIIFVTIVTICMIMFSARGFAAENEIPIIQSPEYGTTFGVENIIIKWKGCKKATNYCISIKDLTSGKTLIKNKKTDKSITEFTFSKDYLKDGHLYKIALSAKVKDSEDLWADMVCFYVDDDTVIGTPQLLKTYIVDKKYAGISWSKIKNAKGYRVYRKTANGDWSRLGIVSATTYTDKTCKSNTTYYYTVRAYCESDGEVILSDYNISGIRFKITGSNSGSTSNTSDTKKISNPEYYTWKQQDGRWASLKLGSSGAKTYTMGKYGCAVTSVAMLLAKANVNVDEKFDPGVLCVKLRNSGGILQNGNFDWSSVKTYGLSYCYSDSLDGNDTKKNTKIAQLIKEGYYVVVKVNSSHFVAVNKVENGNVVIMDPNIGQTKTRLFSAYPSTPSSIRVYKKN